MPRLQILNGKRQGAVFDLQVGGELVIGHRATASVAIDDPWVSWDHARIYFEGPLCQIEDLGSTNGTYVNCVRVKREELRHEDIVFLGKTHVLFLAPADLGPDPFVVADSGLGGLSSEQGLFNSGSGIPPLVGVNLGANTPRMGAPTPPLNRDPFAAAAAAREPRGRLGDLDDLDDLFGDGGVDPFASGPDYSGLEPARDTQKLPRDRPDDLAISYSREGQDVPRAVSNPFSDDPISSGVLRVNYGGGFDANELGGMPTVPPPPRAKKDPFAETLGDDLLSPLREEAQREASRRSLSLSQIDDDHGEPELPAPSEREIADLLEASGRGRRPNLGESSIEMEQLAALERQPASEMRTREIDTRDVASIIAEHEAREAAQSGAQRRAAPTSVLPPPPPPLAPSPPPPPPRSPGPEWSGSTSAPSLQATPPMGTESTHADLTSELVGKQGDVAQSAFERSRLEDEVRRLRMALQAVQARDPQAIQIAAQTLRDAELGRLAQRVAELERDLAAARRTLGEREQELDDVTDEMIAKEDLIDQLRRQLGGAVPEDLSSLEF